MKDQIKPRRRAYRRSDFGRPKFVELDPQIAPATREAKFWARYAIPSGIGAFWIIFAASNWDALARLLASLSYALAPDNALHRSPQENWAIARNSMRNHTLS